MKTDFYNRGQSLVGIIIVLIIVGVITGGLYLYLSKQIPEVAEGPTKEITEPKKEIVVPPEGETEGVGRGVSCKRETTKRGVTCGGDFYNDYCENFADGTGYADVMQCNASTGSNCSLLVIVNRIFCSYGCQNGVCLSSSGEPTPPSEIIPEPEPEPEPEEPTVKKCSDGTPNMACSASKPLYCQNFKLVDACMTCGCPEGKICQQDNTCAQTDLGEKIYVLENGNPQEKLDLLFIPSNISNFSTLRSKLNDILYKSGININGEPMVSLFTVEPFKSHKSRFNIAYVDKNIDEDLFGCYKESADPNQPPKLHYYYLCNDSKIKEGYKIFEPDYIIVIFDEPGYTSSGGEIQYLSINLESSSRFATLSWTFVHEFGHQLGGLADEYVTTDSPSRHCGTAVSSTCFENYEKALEYYPNLDTLGCPKWCQSYDLNKDTILMRENSECGAIKNQADCRAILGGASCTWFELKHPFFNSHCVTTQGGGNIGINCEGDTGCYFGGDYGQLAFNPGGSIMGGATKFNKLSKDHLESILNCCYPRKETSFCQSFRNQFKNIPASASILPDLRKAFNKITSCP